MTMFAPKGSRKIFFAISALLKNLSKKEFVMNSDSKFLGKIEVEIPENTDGSKMKKNLILEIRDS